MRDQGENVAGVVSLTTDETLTEANASACARELSTVFSKLRNHFPEARGVELFVAGPTVLALCAGRAVNPNQFELGVPNFSPDGYLPALRLPWRTGAPPPISLDAKEELFRRQVLDEVNDAVQQLVKRLEPEQVVLPSGMGLSTDAARAFADAMVGHLQEMQVSREMTDGLFQLDARQHQLRFGHRFLEALRLQEGPARSRLVSLLVLHSLYHLTHGVDSQYRALGPADSLLEEADYWADAFALLSLTTMDIAWGGRSAEERCGEVLAENVAAHLEALMMFDRMEQGERVRRLSARQLRRYLTWSLQLVRVSRVQSIEEVGRILGDRLLLELAPMSSRVSGGQVEVSDAVPDAGLYLSVNGRLVHPFASPRQLDAKGLVEAVRDADLSFLQGAMVKVLSENPAL